MGGMIDRDRWIEPPKKETKKPWVCWSVASTIVSFFGCGIARSIKGSVGGAAGLGLVHRDDVAEACHGDHHLGLHPLENVLGGGGTARLN
jgi:hypothetical protein